MILINKIINMLTLEKKGLIASPNNNFNIHGFESKGGMSRSNLWGVYRKVSNWRKFDS